MADYFIDVEGTDQKPDSQEKTENSFLKLLFSDFDECLKAKFGDKITSSRNVLRNNTLTRKEVQIDETENSEMRTITKKVLENSIVLSPNFEKLHAVPPVEISDKNLRKQRKAEREQSKGKKWYGLPATEMTEEIKHDLEVLQMRSVIDPKHFYKKNDLKVLPKYFQIGKVMDSPIDFHSDRLTKKERKKTLVDELLADAEFSRYNKRKYNEIITEKQKTHYKAWRQAKRLKRKKK